MAALPSLVGFGSLGTWPSNEELQELRSSLLEHECLGQVKEVVGRLSELWDTLLANDATLEPISGHAAAEQIATWVSSGKPIMTTVTQQNMLSFPLTVLKHLCDYLTYVKRTSSHSAILDHAAKAGGIQGFCAGLLSALAAAGSRDEEVLGFTELWHLRNGQTSCLAVRCKSPASLATVQKVLERHDLSYISVLRDANDATITVALASVPVVSKELTNHGVTVVDTGLTGRYHTQNHLEVPEKVVGAFGKQQVVRSNTDGKTLPQNNGILDAIRDILLQRSNWYSVITEAVSPLAELDGSPFILAVGSDAIPLTVSRKFKVLKTSNLPKLPALSRQEELLQKYPAHAVAVIRMSCKFPGADSLDEFWQLLTNGTSMAEQVPLDRWPETFSTRGNSAKGKFWGNFMQGIDLFDHRFFKKSAREAASMDPQQRLLLQCAYEALASSGYFSNSNRARDIGCYLGVCATDYDANVASHPPNAFSTLGTLRAFLSGKISHFFGWSGPSITFDTACSSSAVAIHTACRAIQADECAQALVGGVALFTTPYLYENLSAAHFLSPTGATKPFDAKADGYCRGEGVGLVVLKKLSAAVADGDDIRAVIGGSAVNQNDSCVPIMVPHSSSQGVLYRRVAQQAGVLPHQVSFVESRGTGTPVGDPIEMESIRAVFGGPHRQNELVVSSVKGNIGHLEGASGVAGLIKAILQIEHRTAVRQASCQSLNPKIPALGPDRIVVPTSSVPLADGFLVACVNNYGAAGSNAAMVLMEPPRTSVEGSSEVGFLSKYPILISANSQASVVEYCRALRNYCQQSADNGRLLGSIAFKLAKRQNLDLPYALVAAASDMRDLETQLTRQLTESTSSVHQRPPRPPLVLAFGGQVRDYVGLSKQLWQQSAILRSHLDRCDELLRFMGYPSLYPAIFQSEPIEDTVTLHAGVFALQYATAKAWIECGLAVDAVVGHSLGQLTALSVSGVLSLEDGLRFVAGRASLMKTHWGKEAGAMIAVEADLETLSSLPQSLEIACYNGPTSHVLVGDKVSVDQFQGVLSQKGLRFKRLDVTNGYHSRFTEPLIQPLKELASNLRFHKATVPVETCTDGSSWPEATANLLAMHTRDPVFFAQAVQRLAKQLGACTWLEAGSDSSVTGMVRRALDSTDVAQHAFQPISLGKPNSLDAVVDSTMQLWKRGHNLQFWNFHPLQKSQHDPLHLPPYQFEKHKHWLELIPPQSAAPAATSQIPAPAFQPEYIPQLISLVKHDVEGALFRIDPHCDEYKRLVSGHVVAGSPLCPATVYMEMAARACRILSDQMSAPLLSFSDLRIDSPLGLAANQDLAMALRPRTERSWEFSVTGRLKDDARQTIVSHVSGTVEVRTDAAAVSHEFSRYERLTGPEAIEALYQDPESESIRGAMLYKMFSRVVEYGEAYRGLKSVAAKSGRIAGTVVSVPRAQSITRPPTLDSFMQVSGIHANSIYPCADNEVYVFTKLDRLQFGPGFERDSATKTSTSSWLIFSNLAASGSKELTNDIFVFDSISKRLVVLILGARFNNVRLSSLSKVLSKVNGPTNESIKSHLREQERYVPLRGHNNFTNPSAPTTRRDSIFSEVCSVFEKVAEVPRDKVKGNLSTDDLGIDSLMMLEVISELSSQFAIDLPVEDMEGLTDVDSLVRYLQSRGCGPKDSFVPHSGSTTTIQSSRSSIKPASSPTSSVSPTPAEPDMSQQLEKIGNLLKEHLELDSLPGLDANLADLGLDSLLAIELASDIEQLFSVAVDLYQLNETSTVGDLLRLIGLDGGSTLELSKPALEQEPGQYAQETHAPREEPIVIPQKSQPTSAHHADLPNAYDTFEEVRFDFDRFSKQEGFEDFWRNVYPDQERLVLAYTADAFKKLGADLASISEGNLLPKLSILPKHEHLLERMHKILADGRYINGEQSSGYTRTSNHFGLASPQVLLEEINNKFPIHASEHRLLNVTGSRLAECLTGKVDPLALLFANRTNRQLLADVYDLAPMCRATTRLLADFLSRAFSPSNKNETFHFLEVGGGTGGTTKFLVEYLTRRGVPCTYTFTDISSALVGAAKKTLSSYSCMRYATLDVEAPPPPDFEGRFHAIISTNCIHATRNATASLANLRRMLRPQDGLLALVEFTRGLYWFDLVYGLLDGWWLFSDGRKHALADTAFWERSLKAAGYGRTSWTDGNTPESRTLRVICGFNSAGGSAQQDRDLEPRQLEKRAGVPMQTVVWKRVDGLDLCADIYYPQDGKDEVGKKRRVALLFHGGGHVLFTRKDINMKHIKTLLERGFLPVSVDYRLCPEVNLAQGPMTDACDALAWARSTLPHLALAQPDVQINSEKLAAVGWSSGGHLAMTLAYTAKSRGVQPPDVVLAFYCPSNFEDEWWKHPIYPRHVKESPDAEYDLLEGVGDKPIAGYKPTTSLGAPMSLSDPRWRIIIHYNWKAQLVPLLITGLPGKTVAAARGGGFESLSMPAPEAIRAASPFAQIVAGDYHTPTFIVHGDRDDLIPCQQSRDTIEALRAAGVEAGFAVPRGAGHAFDLWSDEDPQGTGWAAIQEGYDFVCRRVFEG
ncbi:Methylphloroacetophenone synthase [Diplogelasinospora grovesii]|uniref:Methylphloroacetophenone synthase n=1 Tax=Diplogelasinospora grovesii TaxID=303347 RepID=A0AAN6N448_9PEZI|nr:Methylphloroacetophenone synthase [Diplogelasinospora grovesii]